jgi:hypothetical protein
MLSRAKLYLMNYLWYIWCDETFSDNIEYGLKVPIRLNKI